MTIGVLALQGAFREHLAHLAALGEEPRRVRTADDLTGLDGIILPGGESTAMARLLLDTGLLQPLHDAIVDGLPVWGTCAGLILLAKDIIGDGAIVGSHTAAKDAVSHSAPPARLALMDIAVRRNAYGRQLGSFSTAALVPAVSDAPIKMVFIRAPYIESAGPSVDILARVDGRIVAAREGHMLATSFHPELTDDLAFHRYFAHLCHARTSAARSA